MIGRSCTCLHTRRWYLTQITTGRCRVLASAIQSRCQGKERGSIGHQVSPVPCYLCLKLLSLSLAPHVLLACLPRCPPITRSLAPLVRSLTLRSEKSSNIYNTDVLTKILKEEGKDLFDARSASLGHTLQGGVPSPLDRTRAARLSLKCMQFLEKHATPNAQSAKGKKSYTKETAAMIAIRGSEIIYPTMDEVKAKADMKLRKGRDEWWRSIKDLAEVRHIPFVLRMKLINRSWEVDLDWLFLIW
jgi:hypothetical protein